MTKQEFERLTGMAADDQVFPTAEAIYLNAGALTKEDVCKEIKAHPYLLESEVVSELARTAGEKMLEARRCRIRIDEMANVLLRAAGEASSEVIWNEVADVLGHGRVIVYKLQNEEGLSSADINYIRENLK